MHNLILSPRLSSDSRALWKECQTSEDWRAHKAYRHQVPGGLVNPTVYGEMQFCDIIASRSGLKLLEPPVGFLAHLSKSKPEWMHRKVTFMHHRDLIQVTERSFIKPANDKVFVAGVYELGKDVPHKYIDPTCPVLVSGVVDFEIEYRCYALDYEVQTLSCYQWPGMLHLENPDESAAALSFANEVLAGSRDLLPSACVLDVGRFENGSWAVIEANQAYASGIYYEAVIAKVLPVIARAASLTVSEADEQYVRPL